MTQDAYTGVSRKKGTPWSVKFFDTAASRLIAVCGVGTIAAILLVVVVLVITAAPLWSNPEIGQWRSGEVPEYAHVGIDAEAVMFWGLTDEGSIELRDVAAATLLKEFPSNLPEGTEITATAVSIDRRFLTLGLNDGSFLIVTPTFSDELLMPEELPEGVATDSENPVVSVGEVVYQWIDATTIRRIELSEVEWTEPLELGDGPILAIDYLPDDSANRLSQNASASVLAVVGESLVLAELSSRKNFLTGKMTNSVDVSRCGLTQRAEGGKPLYIGLLNDRAEGVVVWKNGTLDRYTTRDGEPQYMESQSVGDGAEITSAALLLARQNLLCGLDNGVLQGWMVTRPDADAVEEETLAEDGYQLILAHEIGVSDKPITAVTSSEQTHLALAADETGKTGLVFVTTDKLLSSAPLEDQAGQEIEESVKELSMSPRGDAVAVLTGSHLRVAKFELGHPEASMSTFFGKVWYEGHSRPKYIWQSSAGTEKSEIKLSLIPLVFGTIKATVYAMLISVPLALLAAVYTSEFLSPAGRGRVKPVIEMMASLPSVVLGYIAAIVFAPFLQEHLLTILLGFMVIPFLYVLAGNLWTLLPVDQMVRFQAARIGLMLMILPLGGLISVALSPWIEAWLFGGNLVMWLSSEEGSSFGGWFMLLLPLVTLCMTVIVLGPMAEITRRFAVNCSPLKYAIFSIVRLLACGALVLLTAAMFAAIFDGCGFDLRGSFVGAYQDRNALLVGIALGFCVIPIIYTLSDDALQAVPGQLRSASLGCGATPWQTTMRIVVPSAMSGLFSAIMIGLGRAVGETMVVLMAAGNTPVMEWSPFNGFRTLSATLATELPEAAKGSTHFRTLFLAALLLFLLTLVANTLAEFVRIRFRKRAAQL